jgi:hypothetical protein
MIRRWAATTIGCATVCVWLGCEPDPPATPTSRPSTVPAATTSATAPATAPVVEKKPPTDLISVVLANDPAFPSTRPLPDAVSLEAAARLIFKEPVYLCPRGDLWITRADAPPTQSQLKSAFRQQTHVIPDRVQFVYWRPLGSMQAEIISKDADGNDVWITPTARAGLPAGITRDWSRALLWNNETMRAAVVPTSDGMSIVSMKDNTIDEQHIKLADAGPGAVCTAVFDVRGILAWSTSAAQPTQVARFVDGKWSMLTPSSTWPAKTLHILSYADGTVLAIGEESDRLVLRSNLVEAVPIDETRVLELVKQLADKLPEVRERAQADLANVGPAAWPTLERIQSTQPAEARVRIRAILGDQITPTISGLTPERGRGRLVSRLRDNGVVLWMEAGVSSVDSNNLVITTAPAWLALRPQQSARMVPEPVWRDQRPESAPIQSWGDEWILEHDVDGPMRWMGNHLVPLTKQNEKMFNRFVGIDADSRWVLKTIDPNGPTLVIDPTLLDPKPKLPVWTINAGRKKVGWDKDGWPVQERGGFWVLKHGAWAGLKKEEVDALHTELPQPTTVSTAPSSLLTDAAGNVYSDGLNSLVVERPGGKTISWPLPPEATGEGVLQGRPVLIDAAGKLFLFNAPGRVIRITPQLAKDEPFKIDAIFTRHIPASDIRRIWKDPSGRIVIASGGNVLSVAFPEGMIDTAMSNMIPARSLAEALQEESGPEAATK